MAKKFVKHHQLGRPAKTFVLIRENKDKTVDFGLDDGTVIVERCPLGPQIDISRSYAEIVDEDDDAVKAAKSLRTKANKLKKAAEEAAKTAEASKGKAGYDDLVRAAQEAADEAVKADEAADAAEKALQEG